MASGLAQDPAIRGRYSREDELQHEQIEPGRFELHHPEERSEIGHRPASEHPDPISSKRQLSDRDKISIILAIQEGKQKKRIASDYGCHRSTIHAIINKWKSGQSHSRKPYVSQDRFKLSAQDEERVLVYVALNKNVTLQNIINKLKLSVKKDTISRFLKANNLKIYATTKKLLLDKAEKERRFLWAFDRKDWRLADWKTVCFTDETTIKNHQNNYKPTCIESKNERSNRFNPSQPSAKHKVSVQGK